MSHSILLVMTALFIKHFLADFLLQTAYMLGKGKTGSGWILPLAAHCLVHALFTLIIFLFFKPDLALGLALLDFVIHFIVDRIKASPSLGGRFKPTDSYFWWALGADQLAHGLTYIGLIYIAS